MQKDKSQEPYPHGNGCWRIQPKDLCRFGHALRHNTLIEKQTFNNMLEREPPLGFMVDRDEKNNVVGYGHPGTGKELSSFLHSKSFWKKLKNIFKEISDYLYYIAKGLKAAKEAKENYDALKQTFREK